MKRVLILGGQGFIGQNLSKKLLEEKLDVTVFEKHIRKSQVLENCKYIEGDFTQLEKHKTIFDDIDVVVHLISTTIPNSDMEKVKFDIETNLLSTIDLLNICVEKKIKKLLFSSSGGTIYGDTLNIHIDENEAKNPICAYGINKLAIENYLFMYNKLYGLNYYTLRISNPYGENHISKKQGVINIFIDNVKKQKTIEIWGNGEVKRDYIHIDDVVDAFFKVISNDYAERTFNISSGVAVSLNEIIKIISRYSPVNVKYSSGRQIDLPVSCLDNTLAKQVLNWAPKILLEQGIKNLMN